MHRAAGRRIAIEGAAVAAPGLMLFVAVHSVLIAPIWTRAAKGVPLALLAWCGLAGAFSRLGRLTGRPAADGALFGAAMFLSLVPETLVSNALRLSGVAANGWPGV